MMKFESIMHPNCVPRNKNMRHKNTWPQGQHGRVGSKLACMYCCSNLKCQKFETPFVYGSKGKVVFNQIG